MTALRSRGADTRQAILDAARVRFGESGYDRTTVRAVAGDVGVDPALVIRYFGRKEELFAEATDFALALPDLTGVAPEDLAGALLPPFFAVWEQDVTFLALLRASTSSPEAAATLRAVVARLVQPALAVVVPDRLPERTALLAAQLLGLALCRYVLRVPPLATMAPSQVVAWCTPLVRQCLVGPAPA